MTKTRIRPAEAGDFETLLSIDQQCFSPGVAYDEVELREFLAEPGAIAVVAEAGDAIVGFAVANRHGPAATLTTIDVLSAHRGAGTGSQLLEAIEAKLREIGVRKLILQVDTSNTVAIAFYERRGFARRQRIRNYYADGHDAYVMMKNGGVPPRGAAV